MAVKEGLPATDFSRMNRDYIRNVAEGETVKDGLPATDFSRMNREYIKAIVEEYGGSDITVEELTVTENDTYTAPEGKAYSPVIVNVAGSASPFSSRQVTMNIGSNLVDLQFYAAVAYPAKNPSASGDTPYAAHYIIGDTQSADPAELNENQTFDIVTYNGVGYITANTIFATTKGSFNTVSPSNISLSGDAEIDEDPPMDYLYGAIKIFGDCTITITWGT